jgi:hypothetical protein
MIEEARPKQGKISAEQGNNSMEQGILIPFRVSVHFSHTCFATRGGDLFCLQFLQIEEHQMAGETQSWR